METINKYISTINVVLLLIGYQLILVIYSDKISAVGDTQVVTIPLRIITLALSLFVILINLHKKIVFSNAVKIFFVFWMLLMVRFLWDMLVLPIGTLTVSKQIQLWLYMIGLTIIPMIAVLKSFMIINYKLLFILLYSISAFMCLYLYITVDEMQIANADRFALPGLNSITVGYCGMQLCIMSTYIILICNTQIAYKAIAFVLLILGFVILARAGSRGPLLTLIISVLFVVGSRSRNPIRNMLLIALISVLFYALFNYLIEYINQISPVLYRRLTREEGQLYDRIPLYKQALDLFWANPIIGSRFAIYHNGTYSYAHNIFLDSMMQLGIIGLVLLLSIFTNCIKVIFKMLRDNPEFSFLALFLLEYMSELMVSGSIYTQPSFSILYVLCVYIIYSSRKKPSEFSI